MDLNDTKELRGDCPTDIVQALDAYAQAEGLSRTAYINRVLGGHVEKRMHETSLAHRMLLGNPLYRETPRNNGGMQ